MLLVIVFGTQCEAEHVHESQAWQRMLACVAGSCDCDGDTVAPASRLVSDSESYWSALRDPEVCTSLIFCPGDSGDGDNERHVRYTVPGSSVRVDRWVFWNTEGFGHLTTLDDSPRGSVSSVGITPEIKTDLRVGIG